MRGGAKGVQGGARGGARRCRGEEGKGHHHIADTEAACGGDEAHGGEHEGDRGVTLSQHAYGAVAVAAQGEGWPSSPAQGEGRALCCFG